MDIVPKPPDIYATTLPFHPIREPEAKHAVNRPKNSTPGKDGIPSSILKKLWPLLGSAITILYNHCLEVAGTLPPSDKQPWWQPLSLASRTGAPPGHTDLLPCSLS